MSQIYSIQRKDFGYCIQKCINEGSCISGPLYYELFSSAINLPVSNSLFYGSKAVSKVLYTFGITITLHVD